jgi:hypothetical protein
MMPRQRDKQARELPKINQRIVENILSTTNTPNFCEDCPRESSECAAGVVDSIVVDAKVLNQFAERDRALLIGEIKILPELVRIAHNCADRVEDDNRPIEIDVYRMLEQKLLANLTE